MKRKTIAIPDDLARQIEKVARNEKLSFSAAVARLVDEALHRRKGRYAWIGAGNSGLPDLGINAEKYLRELAKEWRD